MKRNKIWYVIAVIAVITILFIASPDNIWYYVSGVALIGLLIKQTFKKKYKYKFRYKY